MTRKDWNNQFQGLVSAGSKYRFITQGAVFHRRKEAAGKSLIMGLGWTFTRCETSYIARLSLSKIMPGPPFELPGLGNMAGISYWGLCRRNRGAVTSWEEVCRRWGLLCNHLLPKNTFVGTDCLESLYGINIWLAGMLCMSSDQSHHRKGNNVPQHTDRHCRAIKRVSELTTYILNTK